MLTPMLSPYQYQPPVSFSHEAILIDDAYRAGFEHFSSAVTTETFQSKFFRLTTAWKDATRFTSSYNQLLANPSYLELIAMGQKVLPYIFKEMQKEPDHWFLALHVLTSVNPVKPENMGNVAEMTKDWLEWAKTKKYAA
jgi:hypothetical protein